MQCIVGIVIVHVYADHDRNYLGSFHLGQMKHVKHGG